MSSTSSSSPETLTMRRYSSEARCSARYAHWRASSMKCLTIRAISVPAFYIRVTMSESQWDDKLRSFLKKTGEDLKRAGADIKSEAERLMAEAKEPGREEKVREGLKNFTKWAR